MPKRVFLAYERWRVLRVNLDVAATGLCAVALALAPFAAFTHGIDGGRRAVLVLIASAMVAAFEGAVHVLGRLLVGPRRRVLQRLGIRRWTRGRAFFGDRGLGWRERVSFTALAYGLGASAMYYGLAMGVGGVVALAIAFSAGMLFARAAHAAWILQNRAFSLYQRRRVVNINVNLVASGMLAIMLAKGPVILLAELVPDHNQFHQLVFTLLAAAVDGLIDVALYYGFHWYANHRPASRRSVRLRVMRSRKKPVGAIERQVDEAPEGDGPHPRSFFKDASLVQFERMLLSPVYYGVAIGLTYVLVQMDVPRSWAFVVGFTTGVLVTRVLHTIIGLRTGTFRDQIDELDRGPGRGDEWHGHGHGHGAGSGGQQQPPGEVDPMRDDRPGSGACDERSAEANTEGDQCRHVVR